MAYGIANVNGIPNSILDTKVDKETLKTELAKKANTSHKHSADDINSGTLPIARGGTGATTVAAARNALGLGNTSGAVPIANGGTGATTVAAARNALGLGNTSGAVPIANGGTGATTATNARTNLGAFSSSGGTISGDVTVNGNLNMGSNTITKLTTGSKNISIGSSNTTKSDASITLGYNCVNYGAQNLCMGKNNVIDTSSCVIKIKSISGKIVTFDTSDVRAKLTAGSWSVGESVCIISMVYGKYSPNATITAIDKDNGKITLNTAISVNTSQTLILLNETCYWDNVGATAIVCGYNNIAVTDDSYVFGYNNYQTGAYGTIIGSNNENRSNHTFIMGHDNSNIGGLMNCLIGKGLKNDDWDKYLFGKYNNPDISGCFVIGSGSSDTERSNCFRVGNYGGVYSTGNYNSTGADYAEYFQWEDDNPNNEDRRGLFVTLNGSKIRLANAADDFILGIISGNPSVIGDSHEDQWNNMYKTDIYGTSIMEEVWVEEIKEKREIQQAPIYDENGNEIPQEPKYEEVVIEPAHTEIRQVLNPEYDSTQEYIPRSKRPEWATVGMMGKLVVIDDGSCEVNGWCKVGQGGIAIKSEQKTRFRVMKRLDKSHIKVLML